MAQPPHRRQRASQPEDRGLRTEDYFPPSFPGTLLLTSGLPPVLTSPPGPIVPCDLLTSGLPPVFTSPPVSIVPFDLFTSGLPPVFTEPPSGFTGSLGGFAPQPIATRIANMDEKNAAFRKGFMKGSYFRWMDLMTTFFFGASFEKGPTAPVGTATIWSTTSIPDVTFPKTA
jgi:hypothetical protein